MASRRDFLRGTAATAFALSAHPDLLAQSVAPPSANWNSGSVRHLLPTVNDTRILLKASFASALPDAPTLQIGGSSFRGRMSDTRGEYWHFHATDLAPGRTHRLSLTGGDGRALCEPWELATFPGPD